MSSDLGQPRPLGDEPASNGRLDSWKEIASYLRRSVRSAKRWEKEEGLPVHRHFHGKRDSVYAYRVELDGWWTNRGAKLTDQNGAEDAAPPPETETLDVSGAEEPEREEEVARPSSRAPRRAALIGVGFALAIVLVGGVAWLSRNGSSPSAGSLRLPFKARDWVLIAGFENRTGQPLLDGTLEYALERELSNSRHVNVVPRERVGDSLRLMRKPLDTRVDAAIGREICLRDGEIRALITGRIEKLGSKYLLSVELADPNQGASIASVAEKAASEEQLLPAARRISDTVRAMLGENQPSIREGKDKLVKVTTPSLKALQLYSQADALIAQGKSPAAEELLKQAVAEDPGFASAYIHLAHAIANQGRSKEEFLPEAETAFRLSATTTERERYFIRGSYYDFLGQHEKAIAAYGALLSLYPDHYWALGNLADLYRYVDMKKCVQLARTRADGRPKDFAANWFAAYNSVRWSQDPAPAQPYFQRARDAVTSVDVGLLGLMVAWLELWPATAHWLKGDIEATANELDRVAAKADALQSDGKFMIASDYLALGKIEAAERVSRTIEPVVRSSILPQVAFIKGDAAGLRGILPHEALETSVLGWFVVTPILLRTRAGLLPEAQRWLKAREALGEEAWERVGRLEILRGEIAFAQGDLESTIRKLEDGTQLAEDLGLRPEFHLGSETLATALMKKGDTRRAIEILERASERKFLAAVALDRGVPYWMRNRLDLAVLYRNVGRVKEARAIESDLSRLLKLADPDHPIRRELDRLKGS
jgi:tetratricopeptide (TPR) repeat protein